MTAYDPETLSREQLVVELRRLQSVAAGTDHEEIEQVLHDLHVHQIELEMQNRELREAQSLLEESRARYADLYDFAPVGYCTVDREGRILEINRAASLLFGAPREGLVGRPLNGVVRAADRAAVRDHLRACALAQAEVVTELVFSLRGRGAVVVRMVTSPMRDLAGRVLGFRTAFIDESASKRLEDRLRFLGDIGEELVSCVDYPGTLHTIVRASVPSFAELCFIDIVSEEGQLRRALQRNRSAADGHCVVIDIQAAERHIFIVDLNRSATIVDAIANGGALGERHAADRYDERARAVDREVTRQIVAVNCELRRPGADDVDGITYRKLAGQ